jgi:hypothetical protein
LLLPARFNAAKQKTAVIRAGVDEKPGRFRTRCGSVVCIVACG